MMLQIPMIPKLLLLLLALASTSLWADDQPAPAQATLLQKDTDGSTLVTRENVWAILRGRIAKYDPDSYMTSARVTGMLWEDQLFAIKDEFLHHAAEVNYEHALDDATAQAKAIGPITFVYYPGVGNYDFDTQSFPVGRYGLDGSRSFPGSTYVTFERTLASKIPVPEDQAKAIADALREDSGWIEVQVKGTIKACRTSTPGERGALVGWQPKSAEQEPSADFYRMILAVRSVEYRLKTQGTVLLSKTFDDASPSQSAPVPATSP